MVECVEEMLRYLLLKNGCIFSLVICKRVAKMPINKSPCCVTRITFFILVTGNLQIQFTTYSIRLMQECESCKKGDILHVQ